MNDKWKRFFAKGCMVLGILFALAATNLYTEGQPVRAQEMIAQADEGSWKKAGRETGEAAESVGKATKETAGQALETTKEASGNAWDATKKTSKKAWKATKKAVRGAVDAVKKGVGEAVDAVKGK